MLTAEGLWIFVTEPAVLVLVVTTLAVAWPLGRRMADRYRCSRLAAILFVVAVGMLVALTLTPNAPPTGIPIRDRRISCISWAMAGWSGQCFSAPG